MTRAQSALPWRSIVDSLDVAAWLINGGDLRICYANAQAAQLTGRDLDAMQGLAVRELAITPEDLVFWGQDLAEIGRGIHSRTVVEHRGNHGLVPVQRRVVRLDAPPADGGPWLLMTMLGITALQRSEQDLEAVQSELKATLDSAADGVLSCNLDGSIRVFNERLVQIWKLPRALVRKRNTPAMSAFMREQVSDPQAYEQRLTEITLDPLHESHDVLHLNDGTIVERRSMAQRVKGRAVGRIFTFRDITQQLQDQADLRLAAQSFESSLDAIFIADARHQVVRINPSGEQLLGQFAQEVLERPAIDLLCDARSSSAFMAQVEQQWKDCGVWKGELHLPTSDGTPCVVWLSWVALRDATGRLTQSIGFLRDLTAQHAAQKRIEELAYTDVLTGLPNRLMLRQRVNTAIEQARSQGQSFAICFLDLDRFKIVNDSLGHTFGDRVLKLVAQRLQTCLRPVDMLCRLGGDEFVIYLHGAGTSVAQKVAQRVLETMSYPFMLDELKFSVQCSMGLSLYPTDGETLDDLIKQADIAMYRIKERGRGNYGFYQPQMNADLLPRIKLEHAMRQALGQGHMRVHYQPQVSLTSGDIVGAEALLRWTDPEIGAIAPSVFIPLAEESGYIVTLGEWVMEQAVQQALHWLQAGTPLAVSVNVSALEFRQPGYVERVARLLAAAGLPAYLLELELTESILLQDAQEMEHLLSALAQLGVGLSIDDFGTGYSSLAYLKRLPIYKLKIDRSFVQGLAEDGDDLVIVQAILNMGSALRMKVVAEGVETEAQRKILQDMACDSFQGFLCAPALPAAELGVKLRATCQQG